MRDGLRALGPFLLVVGAAAALWPWAEGAYRALVTTASTVLLGGTPPELGQSPYAGLALWAALTLATPIAWRARLRALALGAPLLVGLQVANHVALAQAAQVLEEVGYRYPAAWLYALASAGPLIWPVAVWAGLTLRPWMVHRRDPSTGEPKTTKARSTYSNGRMHAG